MENILKSKRAVTSDLISGLTFTCLATTRAMVIAIGTTCVVTRI
jgi:hypothetical protein